ncbi:hypothetical protein MRX96_033170 [Rhipicephalus microplus]
MLRFAYTLTLVFLCIALSHGAPSLARIEACDEKSCNDTCSKQAQDSDHDIYRGWCDPQGSCRCYHRDLCHADSCKNTCEEKHMNETNLTYECKDNLCVCKWNRKCNITGCEETCNDIYAGKPNIEWWCEDIKCKCRWHGALDENGVPQASLTADKGPYSEKREATIDVVGMDSFYLMKEFHLTATKKAV